MLWFLAYVRAAGGLRALVDVRGGAQERKLVHSAAGLARALAERVRKRGVDIRFEAPGAGSKELRFCALPQLSEKEQ